ncbi:DUF799 domain-containing protein [Leptothrix discophora]|uniref:DUF799 domain-containing protein n=1 Tax=Leptothrix discophora TaxID=89 RepID=A0ABT9FZW2_LEPDI|nr:DUF799 domain-containing protein [Leptothrix discophora]MDP4299769.1 DUF799 domain-containing protein [Leptothrix discophora]
MNPRRPVRCARLALVLGTAALLGACAAPKPYDYSAYKSARPKSILVLPPLNDTSDVNATASVLAQTTRPLAESGYYVIPVTLMAEAFRQNGLSTAGDIHQVEPAKLREVFGADAALYIRVTKYGATYTLLDSAAVVSAEARLVDLQTGAVLWNGAASASSAEQNQRQNGGLLVALVTAVVKQIVNEVTDASHPVAGIASQRLLGAGRPNGLLYGPRSPKYGSD